MTAKILFEVMEHVATITLNRPEKLNALDAESIAGIVAAVQSAGQDDAVRVLVITGAGRAFCSGAEVGGNRPAAGGAGPDAGAEVPVLASKSRLQGGLQRIPL